MKDTRRPDEEPHQVNLRRGRISVPGRAYFITKCIEHRYSRVLTIPECAECLVRSFKWASDNGWWHMLGFVIMPDHYHVASALGEAKTLSQVMYSVGRYTSGEIQRLRRTEGQFWQEGFYEHAIRDRSDLGDVLEYVHGNPVYAGLVTSPDDWPYSTANNRFAEEIDEEWLKLWLPAFRPSKYRFGRDVIPRRYW